MNRISKGAVTVFCSAALVASTTALITDQEGQAFCTEDQYVEFNKTLPMSHPSNRCTAEAQARISWTSWLSGRASTSQFHYLDFLELLTRTAEDKSKRP